MRPSCLNDLKYTLNKLLNPSAPVVIGTTIQASSGGKQVSYKLNNISIDDSMAVFGKWSKIIKTRVETLGELSILGRISELDTFIEKRLGGSRNGRTITWKLMDGTYSYDIITERLVRIDK